MLESKGDTDWFEYISRCKARQELIVSEATRRRVPERRLYVFYHTSGCPHRNRYATWSPRLLRGAYNYQYAAKDPGGYAHNGKYVLQILYDALEDLGGDVSGMTRP